jgi:hypothetical protein
VNTSHCIALLSRAPRLTCVCVRGRSWRYLLAVGLENGLISLWVGSHQAEAKSLRWISLISVPASCVFLSRRRVVPCLTHEPAYVLTSRLTYAARSPSRLCPVDTVQRLRWRKPAGATADTFDLAVGASDHSVRILSFSFSLSASSS